MVMGGWIGGIGMAFGGVWVMWDRMEWDGVGWGGAIARDDMELRSVSAAKAEINVTLTIIPTRMAISVLPRGDTTLAPRAKKARTSELRRELQQHQKFHRGPVIPASHPQHGRTHSEDR